MSHGQGASSAFAASVGETNSEPVSELCLIPNSAECHETATPDDGHGLHPMTPADKRAAIDRAAANVERTFLRWHATGCFTDAAAYATARNTWASMLMKWSDAEGRIGA